MDACSTTREWSVDKLGGDLGPVPRPAGGKAAVGRIRATESCVGRVTPLPPQGLKTSVKRERKTRNLRMKK